MQMSRKHHYNTARLHHIPVKIHMHHTAALLDHDELHLLVPMPGHRPHVQHVAVPFCLKALPAVGGKLPPLGIHGHKMRFQLQRCSLLSIHPPRTRRRSLYLCYQHSIFRQKVN